MQGLSAVEQHRNDVEGLHFVNRSTFDGAVAGGGSLGAATSGPVGPTRVTTARVASTDSNYHDSFAVVEKRANGRPRNGVLDTERYDTAVALVAHRATPHSELVARSYGFAKVLSMVSRAGLALAAAGAFTTGCQIPDPAQADIDRLVPLLCEEAESCLCAVDLGDDECLTARGDAWAERIREGRSRSLAYNAACVAAQQERAVGYGCKAPDDTGESEGHLCSDFCAVFFGDKQAGDECEAFDAVVSDCAPELTCSNGKCVPPCEALTGLPEGGTCLTADLVPTEACATGLVCDQNTRSCVRAPRLGEACPDYRCATDAYCDNAAQICRPLPEDGESCNEARCAPGLYCRWFDNFGTQRCDTYATEGQSCAERSCAPELDCGGSVCRAPAERGESCSSVRCASGLLCSFAGNDRCVEPPAVDGAACPEGICGAALWCDDTMPMQEAQCRARGVIGDLCSGHAQCNSAYCPAGRCAPRPAEGEDCSGTNLCQGGLICEDDVCTTAVGQGAAVCVYQGW